MEEQNISIYVENSILLYTYFFQSSEVSFSSFIYRGKTAYAYH
jgi:hypothetical protein